MRVGRTCIVFASVVGLAASAARAADPSPAAAAAFSEGQALSGEKRYGEAAEKLETAVSADPKFAAAWYALAAARRKSGRCDRAIIAYRRYAQLAPTESEPYYGLGLCLRETGDRAAALTALQRYVKMETRPASQKWTDHARSVIAELQASQSQGGPPADVSSAGAGKERGASKPSASPGNAAYVEAQALRDHGRIEEAIAKFRQSIAADPRSMLPRVALGELLLKIRRDDEAIEVLRAAAERNPTYALAWYDLAFALRVRGRLPEAVDAYQRYIKLRPNDPDPYYGLARALQHLGRQAEARHAYETYLSLEKRASEKRWVESAETQMTTLAPQPRH